MSYLEEAKQFVKSSFARDSEVGTPIDGRFIFQRGIHLTPPVKSEIENAINSLIEQGFLSHDGRLTQKGFNELFPSNLPHVKNKLLNELKSQRLEAGHVVDQRSLLHNLIIKMNKQEAEDLDVVLNQLITDGFLEESGGQFKLTDSGYKKLY